MGDTSSANRQVNVRVDDGVYDQLVARAKRERRTVPQTARLLLSDALNAPVGPPREPESGVPDLAALAVAGGAFQWVAEEPEVYSATSGESL